MLLGFPDRLIFLELLVHAKDAPVLLAVAKSCNFLQYANQEINLAHVALLVSLWKPK